MLQIAIVVTVQCRTASTRVLWSRIPASQVLDARQLALKLIANVTYGYTAAGFSGRMPMAELADSIVQVRVGEGRGWCTQVEGEREIVMFCSWLSDQTA